MVVRVATFGTCSCGGWGRFAYGRRRHICVGFGHDRRETHTVVAPHTAAQSRSRSRWRRARLLGNALGYVETAHRADRDVSGWALPNCARARASSMRPRAIAIPPALLTTARAAPCPSFRLATTLLQAARWRRFERPAVRRTATTARLTASSVHWLPVASSAEARRSDVRTRWAPRSER